MSIIWWNYLKDMKKYINSKNYLDFDWKTKTVYELEKCGRCHFCKGHRKALFCVPKYLIGKTDNAHWIEKKF